MEDTQPYIKEFKHDIVRLIANLYSVECWLDYGLPAHLTDEEIESFIHNVGEKGKNLSKKLTKLHNKMKTSYKIIK